MKTHTIKPRELDMILAALRLWQIPAAHNAVPQAQNEHLYAIAEDSGDELTNEEIDALCERLNCEGRELKPVELSECCHAQIGYDAWVDSNEQLNGGPFDNRCCLNCGMEGPKVWDGQSPPWPRNEREGGADLPNGVDEPPDPDGAAAPITALARVLKAAESYAEDLSTGLDDGTYEEGADELSLLEAAIAQLRKEASNG